MQEGRFLLSNYSFRPPKYEPFLLMQPAGGKDELIEQDIRGETLTLEFDTAQRFCNGWLDLDTSTQAPCPEAREVDAKYEQCMGCRERTGFNPAFYNTDEISEQQVKRNSSPHSLYFAHFGGDKVKVGISHEKRGFKRLLEQGARTAIIVKTFANANTARRYESEASTMLWAIEAMQTKQKEKLLQANYDASEAKKVLLKAFEEFKSRTDTDIEDPELINLDEYYFKDTNLDPTSLLAVSEPKISGTCIGLVGAHMITAQNDMQFMLGIRKLRGYWFNLSSSEVKNEHAAHQASLF